MDAETEALLETYCLHPAAKMKPAEELFLGAVTDWAGHFFARELDAADYHAEGMNILACYRALVSCRLVTVFAVATPSPGSAYAEHYEAMLAAGGAVTDPESCCFDPAAVRPHFDLRPFVLALREGGFDFPRMNMVADLAWKGATKLIRHGRIRPYPVVPMQNELTGMLTFMTPRVPPLIKAA